MTPTLSTLLRPPTPELQILCWSRQLKPVRFNEYAALRFLSNALRAMHNAQAPDCRPIDQLHTTYDGIYSLCLGSLYLHGLLPSGKEGYRALAIQLGSEQLRLTPLQRDKILNTNRYLQLMVSDCPEQVEDLVCQDMLGLGQHTLRQARRVYPDWFD
ncbi:MAG: hypothetical protein IPH37_14275 [Burkholderiales bacterium]|nr:hypothetical protein [Burkholderiales bacterium]MBK9346238.1 hypothetical protein [Burkholderiales bacterium]